MRAHIRRLIHRHPDFNADTIDTLGRLYGTDCEALLDLARRKPALAEKLNPEGELPAQAVYAVRREMAHSLLDIVLRRTGIATLGNPGATVLNRVAAAAAPELGWDADDMAREVQTTMDFLTLPAL
jgi:glycerol-3-phosphate dehydrogenase